MSWALGPRRSRRRSGAIAAAAAAALCLAALLFEGAPGRRAPDGAAAAGCADPAFRWSENDPPINLRHIFCGELRDGEPRGFHALQLHGSADLVGRLESRVHARSGVFSAVVVFKNGRRKFSTFFPEHCTVAEITKSIAYAASGVPASHPVWGIVGASAPIVGGQGFCLDTDGRPFSIRLTMLPNGRVNTAFPN